MTMDASRGFALDVNGLSGISRAERQQAGSGLKPVTQQFEAVFLNMMLKTMRASVPDSGLYNSDAMKMMGQMRDSQLSQAMSTRGIGIADMLQKQLAADNKVQSAEDVAAKHGNIAGIPFGTARSLDTIVAEAQAHRPSSTAMPPEVQVAAGQMATPQQTSHPDSNHGQAGLAALWDAAREQLASRAPHVTKFLARVGDTARRVSEESGIPVRLIVAQAALETGWGRHDVRHEDGREGHNLFGIKAVGRHAAPSRTTTTTEYENGVAQQRQERFRAYDSDENAMRDYARMLTAHPRYQGIAGSTAHEGARLLQQQGYATDPRYAEKLKAIIDQLPESLDAGVSASRTVIAKDTSLQQYASLEDDPARIF